MPGLSPEAAASAGPQTSRVRPFPRKPIEIGTVFRFAVIVREAQELRRIDEALAEAHFLDATDFLARALLERADEFRGLNQAVVRPGIEPGIAAPKPLHREAPRRKV